MAEAHILVIDDQEEALADVVRHLRSIKDVTVSKARTEGEIEAILAGTRKVTLAIANINTNPENNPTTTIEQAVRLQDSQGIRVILCDPSVGDRDLHALHQQFESSFPITTNKGNVIAAVRYLLQHSCSRSCMERLVRLRRPKEKPIFFERQSYTPRDPVIRQLFEGFLIRRDATRRGLR